MSGILLPGYLKWDGVKYIIDPTPAGPIGPTGPSGATGAAGATGATGAAGASAPDGYVYTAIATDAIGTTIVVLPLEENTINSITVTAVAHADGYTLQCWQRNWGFNYYDGYMFIESPAYLIYPLVLSNWDITITPSLTRYDNNLTIIAYSNDPGLVPVSFGVTIKHVAAPSLGGMVPMM